MSGGNPGWDRWWECEGGSGVIMRCGGNESGGRGGRNEERVMVFGWEWELISMFEWQITILYPNKVIAKQADQVRIPTLQSMFSVMQARLQSATETRDRK